MKKSLLFFCLLLSAMIVFAGCNKTEPVAEETAIQEEPVVPEEIVEEMVDETVIEEEVEEPEVVEAELPELPLLDEDGNPYVPDMFTTEEVYAAIDKMVADNKFATRFERDFAIEFMITINAPYISEETFETIKDDYCANITDTDYKTFSWSYLKDDQELYTELFKTELPINYLFLDEKQGEAALQIVNYINSDSFSNEEFSEFAFNYVEFSRENMGYNPINYLLEVFEDPKSKTDFVKRYLDLPDDEFNTLFFGQSDGKITFGDGGTYTYEPDYYLQISHYQYSYTSSHKE